MTARAFDPDHDLDGHQPLREGAITGLIGGTAVALWFLLVDVLAGHPLFTPAFLGAVTSGEADPALAAEDGNRLLLAAVYTPIHYVAFIVVGVAAVALVHRAARSPAVLGLLLMLFLAIQVAFTGGVAVLEQGALGALAWYQIAAGNLIAVAAMGTYLYRRHRGVRTAWARQFDDGRE